MTNNRYHRLAFAALCAFMLAQTLPVGATDGDPIMDLGIFTWLRYQQKQFFSDFTEVAIKDNKIQTPKLTVQMYEPIIIENQDKTNHRIVFLTGLGNKMDYEYMSPVIQPGERWGFEIHTLGEFPFQCSLHPGERGIFTIKLD